MPDTLDTPNTLTAVWVSGVLRVQGNFRVLLLCIYAREKGVVGACFVAWPCPGVQKNGAFRAVGRKVASFAQYSMSIGKNSMSFGKYSASFGKYSVSFRQNSRSFLAKTDPFSAQKWAEQRKFQNVLSGEAPTRCRHRGCLSLDGFISVATTGSRQTTRCRACRCR